MATTRTKRGRKSARKSGATARRVSSRTPEASPAAHRPAEPRVPGTRTGSGKPDKRDTKSTGEKRIRDSFTMPATEYDRIAALKKRCLSLGVRMKKSELLRAGIATLNEMPDERLKEVVSRVTNVKTGRPAGERKASKAKRVK